jgi:hypothetical protein
MTRSRSALVAACLLATTLMGAAHAGATGTQHRLVLFSVALTGQQTTTWESHGARVWCADSSQQVAFDGSGTRTLNFRLDGPPVDQAIEPGHVPALATTLHVDESRSGSFALHYAAVTDRPATCPSAPTSDLVADSSGCTAQALTTAAAVETVGKRPTLLTNRLPYDADCPFLVKDLSTEGEWSTPEPAAAHPETTGKLLSLDATPLTAPALPALAPATRRAHAASTWTVAIDGGTLAVTTTLDVTAQIRLHPTIVPGHSIAGVSLGETYARVQAAARSYGGVSLPDSAEVSGKHTTWAIGVRVPYVYPGFGNDEIRAVLIAGPTPGARGGLVHRRPPPTARVSFVELGSSLEVTAGGIGAGSTSTASRRAHPRPRTWQSCGVGGCTRGLLIDGPGRRRTVFTLFKNVIQDVQIGCRASGVIPIAQEARC